MTDTVDKATRSRIMSKIRSISKIERIPDRYHGLRLRSHPKGIYGSPDFANKTQKIALFVDGCFWHGCPEHYKRPKSNVPYWKNKIVTNQARDRRVDERLKLEGWTVIRVWEHEL